MPAVFYSTDENLSSICEIYVSQHVIALLGSFARDGTKEVKGRFKGCEGRWSHMVLLQEQSL